MVLSLFVRDVALIGSVALSNRFDELVDCSEFAASESFALFCVAAVSCTTSS